VRRISDLELEGSVRWAPEVRWDSPELSGHLDTADACLLPHDYGIQLNNRALAAACVHGVPVIAVGGQPREPALLHEENILLCPPDCPRALAAALRSLMESGALRGRIAEGASALAREHYDWSRAIDRIEDALRVARSTASLSDSHQTPRPQSRVQLS
jgi:glycosyltransferase involved in cell wall biosynthesis